MCAGLNRSIIKGEIMWVPTGRCSTLAPTDLQSHPQGCSRTGSLALGLLGLSSPHSDSEMAAHFPLQEGAATSSSRRHTPPPGGPKRKAGRPCSKGPPPRRLQGSS